MAIDVIDYLYKAEECVLAGRLSEAGAYLKKIGLDKIPRKEAARAAQLYRRVGQYETALQILLPIVRPTAKSLQPANPDEIIECAVCLQRAGAIEEAYSMLDAVPADQAPEALLYKTTMRFSEWDYRGGVPNLLRLINLCPRDSYLNRLAQYHLAGAFIVEGKFHEAETLLGEIREMTSQKGEGLMFFNTLELSTQVAVLTKNFTVAHQCLKEAEAVAQAAPWIESSWILKWRSIMDAYHKKDVSCLEPARKEAIMKRQWEVLRELDYAACKIEKNDSTLLRLFFGSNFPGYRRLLAKEFGEPPMNQAFIQKDGSYIADNKDAIWLFSDHKVAASLGRYAHNLMVLLVSDIYRGMRTGQIHNRLFVGEQYHPGSSFERVQQIVQEARPVIEVQLAGLQIAFSDDTYRLDFSGFRGSLEVPKILPRLAITTKRDNVPKTGTK